MSENLRTFEVLGKEVTCRRQKKGMSLPDVSEKTRIRIQFLEAIESGDISLLPGAIYARGFIRTYLDLLDSPDLWPEYDENLKNISPEKSKESVVQYLPIQKGFQKVSRIWIFALLVFAICISLYMIWQQKDALTVQMGDIPDISQGTSAEKPGETVLPASESEKLKARTAEDASAASASADNPVQQPDTSWIPGSEESASEQVLSSKTGVLTIKTSDQCWISVSQDGGKTFQRTLSRGETFETNVEKKTLIRFGNAGAVTLQWGGKVIREIGSAGDVVNIVFLPDGSMKRL